jgi:hypothetical protein
MNDKPEMMYCGFMGKICDGACSIKQCEYKKFTLATCKLKFIPATPWMEGMSDYEWKTLHDMINGRCQNDKN